MYVKFIAHAGFALTSGQTTVMVDPWFFSSEMNEPVLLGLLPPFRTIDFMIPEGRDDIGSFYSNGIFVSHFHTHHAPLKEIRVLLQQAGALGGEVILGTPPLVPADRLKIAENLGLKEGSYKISEVIEYGPTIFHVGEFKVTGWVHTWDHHVAWLFECPTGSFLHIADAQINRNRMTRELDPFWQKLADLKPDFLAISAAGHVLRHGEGAGAYLYEGSSLSPSEAARVTALIQPKLAAVIGVFQHSHWTKRAEFPLPADYVEDAFAWSVRHLCYRTRCLVLRPGDELYLQHPAQPARVHVSL